jgi:hypothetical protein
MSVGEHCRRSADQLGRRLLLNHFPLRHFELSHHGVLVDTVNSGPTSARQLDGSERREDHELKRADSQWTLHQNDPPAMSTGASGSIARLPIGDDGSD